MIVIFPQGKTMRIPVIKRALGVAVILFLLAGVGVAGYLTRQQWLPLISSVS